MKAVVYAAVAACLACAPSVNQDAFKKFEAATTELRDGADKSLTRQARWAQQRFERSIQQSDVDTLTNRYIQQLLLDPVDNDPFGAQYPVEPFFIATRKFKTAVNALNGAVADYAALLSDLVGSGHVTTDELDRRVTDINNGVEGTAVALSDKPPEKKLAIISVGTASLFEEFLLHRKHGILVRAVRENAPAIAGVCALLADGMTIAARQVRSEYDERSFRIANELTHTRTGSGNRRDLIKSLMNLNDLYTEHLETLRTMHDVYSQLPAAHAELALTGKAMNFESLERLYQAARRLQAALPREE
jgi:hypothetical protein